jgi:hypothetical protein
MRSSPAGGRAVVKDAAVGPVPGLRLAIDPDGNRFRLTEHR